MAEVTDTRAGFVSLIGEPNVGKSTLLNRLVGTKLSIVAHKAQTTRAQMRGIATRSRSQLVFVDTPGLFDPKRRLDRAMVAAAWNSVADADVTVLLSDANRGCSDRSLGIVESLHARRRRGQALALAINKIDLVKPESLLRIVEVLADSGIFDAVFMISATGGGGVDDLGDWLASKVPKGPWLYPADQISDTPYRKLVAEITREKLILRLHQELPYQLTVETDNWKDNEDGSVRIDQIIYVKRASHKGMILGSGGSVIKSVGLSARRAIESLVEKHVHLFLRVKVRPGWMEEEARFNEMGLDFQGSARPVRA